MSIQINGIDKPKNCFDCPCIDAEFEECAAREHYLLPKDEYGAVLGDVPDWCPITELQTCEELPSAQPKHTDKRTETHACDLIDRQAAIQALDNAAENWNIAEPYHEGIRAGFRNSAILIMSFPSAQPVRPKGKWVGVHAYCNHLNEEAKINGKTERYLPSGMVSGVYCNKCWCIADKKSDFCPNCGADMRGEQDE